jgi:hypothetical protein
LETAHYSGEFERIREDNTSREYAAALPAILFIQKRSCLQANGKK